MTPGSSGPSSRSAPRVPVTGSSMRTTGVVRSPSLRTDSSTRLGLPACTRGGVHRAFDLEAKAGQRHGHHREQHERGRGRAEDEQLEHAEQAAGDDEDDRAERDQPALSGQHGARSPSRLDGTRRGKRQRRAALGGDSERSERSEPSESHLARALGTGTVRRTSPITSAERMPASCASGVTTSRCASTGSASALMSSGTT